MFVVFYTVNLCTYIYIYIYIYTHTQEVTNNMGQINKNSLVPTLF